MTISGKRATILPVVILALAAVAVLRAADIWVGFTAAEAQTVVAEETIALTTAQPAFTASPSEVERRLLEQLAVRREALDKRERDIETREKLLEATELRLNDRFTALDGEIETLRQLLAQKKEVETAEYEALSDAYERMKPREAARIFEVLDDELLAPVASGMRTQAIAGVLAEMNPEKARALTKLLADRGVVTSDETQ